MVPAGGFLRTWRVVVAPEPGHCGWELGVALGAVVGALAEAEVEVVFAGF